jgi:hypothetical protein
MAFQKAAFSLPVVVHACNLVGCPSIFFAFSSFRPLPLKPSWQSSRSVWFGLVRQSVSQSVRSSRADSCSIVAVFVNQPPPETANP